MATHHSTGSKQLFQIGSLRVPNFRGHFEALNDIFLGITWARRVIALLSPRWDLSNGLLNDPNGDHMQKLWPGEVGIPTYHFGAHKNVGVSSSRILFKVFFPSMIYVKIPFASL